MEKTAVEWLINELKSLGIYSSTLKEKCESAKEMEKQQIIEAYEEGDANGANRIYYHDNRDDVSAEQYYNQKFNN